MKENIATIWESKTAQQLSMALVGIDDAQTMEKFLRDVMTEKEIIEVSSRLEAARMLKAGIKYSDIIEKTKLSSRTVARISDWMQNGSGGYEAVLGQVTDHSHIPPASAE
ncbi:MAG: YerC/YecD family TrpR-related protein [Candidatus Saccharibacteria bacterium]